jgi:hypothetical protein
MIEYWWKETEGQTSPVREHVYIGTSRMVRAAVRRLRAENEEENVTFRWVAPFDDGRPKLSPAYQ